MKTINIHFPEGILLSVPTDESLDTMIAVIEEFLDEVETYNHPSWINLALRFSTWYAGTSVLGITNFPSPGAIGTLFVNWLPGRDDRNSRPAVW